MNALIIEMSAEERATKLPEQEAIAETALQGAARFALAMETIRDQELYLAVAESWDAYLASVWKEKIEKSGRRYFDMFKQHLTIRDACRQAGLPENALPQGEKVSRVAKKNITVAQAVELFQELDRTGTPPTQSQVNKLRTQHGYDQLKRKTRTSLLETEVDVAVNELRKYLQEFSKAALDWQVQAKDWSNTEIEVKSHKVVQSLAPQLEVILELVMERVDGNQLLLAYYDTDQKFGGPLNGAKEFMQRAEQVTRSTATVEELPVAAPAAEAPKKRGRRKGSKNKTASTNGNAPDDEESAVVYDVALKDETGQWNTVSFTSECEAKNEYQEQLNMGEKPVIIKEQNGRNEILMRAPGAEVPEGDYIIRPQ